VTFGVHRASSDAGLSEFDPPLLSLIQPPISHLGRQRAFLHVLKKLILEFTGLRPVRRTCELLAPASVMILVSECKNAIAPIESIFTACHVSSSHRSFPVSFAYA